MHKSVLLVVTARIAQNTRYLGGSRNWHHRESKASRSRASEFQLMLIIMPRGDLAMSIGEGERTGGF